MDGIEKGAFLKLFNRDGYVLDFSTNGLDTFTMESVGIPICRKYGMSKGKSLVAYCNDATEDDVVKLFSDLLKHYEIHCMGDYREEKYHQLYERCKAIIEKETNIVTLTLPAIVCVNREYIKDLSTRAMRDVENGEYDSALTKSRTLLEEVFCYVIEKQKQEPLQKGDIRKLYMQVKDLYSMHGDAGIDRRINELLTGLEKIIKAITEMRNTNSDAHGVGQKRISIAQHHARLFVNSAMTMADFILSVSERKQ